MIQERSNLNSFKDRKLTRTLTRSSSIQRSKTTEEKDGQKTMRQTDIKKKDKKRQEKTRKDKKRHEKTRKDKKRQ